VEKFNEIKGLLFNGFIGLLVGWGGFTQLFPNVLEMLGDVAELGSYSALRIFSIIFFLSIIFLITSYWWIWGIANYLGSELQSDYKSSAFILSLGLKLLPILGFIIDPFFVHSSYKWFNFFEFTIWYYLLIAIIELVLVSRIFYPKSGVKLLKVNTVIFSLDVVLGIGVVSFIEPWANYKTDFIYEVVGVGAIYIAAILITFYRIKEPKEENDFRDLAIGFLTLTFLLGAFPSVNYNYGVGLGALCIILIGILILGIRWFKSFRKKKSTLINLVLVGVVLMILLRLHGALMMHSNKNYFEERKTASMMISKIKINPLVAFRYLKNKGAESINAMDIENIIELVEENHKWAYMYKGLDLKHINYDTVRYKNGDISIKTWIELKEKFNVRTFFFKNYDPQLKLETQKSLNEFYNSNYKYIHTSIIDSVLRPIQDLKDQISQEQFSGFETYYHPINYYSETLDFYKERLNKMDSVRALSDFIIRIDSLYKGQRAKSTVDHWNYKVLREDKANKVVELLNGIYEFNNIGIDTTLKQIKKDVYLFELFSRHKNLEYKERYHKAQTIFHVYLKDSQRVGVYILLYALVVAILFLWFWYHDKKDSNLNADTSFGFVIVWFLSVLVTLAYIARPIEAENINPEKPHWMMNLDNWYSHTDFAVSTWGKEEKEEPKPTSITIKNDHKKLVRSLETINETLDSINAALSPIKEIEVDKLNKSYDHIESISGDVDTINIRLKNHGDYPDKLEENQTK